MASIKHTCYDSENRVSEVHFFGQMLGLTAGLLLQQLPLAVDDTQDQQGQQHGGKSAADDRGQGHVPRAGHHRGQRHQVHAAAACEEGGRKTIVKHSRTAGR